MTTLNDITHYINLWQQGDQEALGHVLPLIEKYLRGIAHQFMLMERKGHTFTTRDLVQEACLKLSQNPSNEKFNDRKHFFAVAAKVMRQILITHANARHTQKRGGDEWERLSMDLDAIGPNAKNVLGDIDEAINLLEKRNREAAEIVALYYFVGFTTDEISEALSLSSATVKRRLKVARDWLKSYLLTSTGEEKATGANKHDLIL